MILNADFRAASLFVVNCVVSPVVPLVGGVDVDSMKFSL
ncbi:hypothetical protein SOHN41_02494 [Shewanella sp. HN-41]|nr:hypothetical protein SOHN41_02494 [Shewanella sp. HN-41]